MLTNYESFSQGQKDSFSSICNKMLANTFLCRDKENNKNDYYFLINYKDLFEEFFNILGYELNVKTDLGVAFISGTPSANTIKLKRDHTIVLLILRILYHEKMKETSLNENISVNVEDIHTKYNYLEIKKRINKTDLIESLRLFRRFNIIEILGDITSSSARIIIYPTILFAVNTEQISEVYETIEHISDESEAA